MRNDRVKNVILVVLAICLISLTVAFAVMSSNLKISGTASVNKSEWKIHFDNLQNPVASGSADVGTATLSGDKIILTVSDGIFKAPGDKITYIVDVVNEGDINAKVDVVSTIIGDCASEDGSDVTKYCNKIKAKLIYKDSGEEVKKDDKLNAGENKTLNLIITYDENKELTDVSSKPITIGNITSTITYIMDDKSGDSGSDDPSKPITPTNQAICKRAETLHTEECTYSYSSYCAGAGYSSTGAKKTTTITYGNLNEDGEELVSGDAFDCDVNGDGVYDPKTERFYYVSDYYNTDTKQFESDYATLIYYNSISEGEPSNTSTYVYDSTGNNYNGPATAIKQLPTTSQWSNVSLKNTERQLLTETETTSSNGNDLPTAFSYSGYSARLLTAQELNKACNITLGNYTQGELDKCEFLMENTGYSSQLPPGYWLETPVTSSNLIWFVYGYRFVVNSSSNSGGIGVRPVIEVPKNKISYSTDPSDIEVPTSLSTTIKVYKTGTNKLVSSETWSDSYLDISFGKIEGGDKNSKIYYCIGDNCTPNTQYNNSKITIKKDGEYIIRYYVMGSNGNTGEISEYNAKVDSIAPEVTIEGNPTETTSKEIYLKIKAIDTISGIKSVTVNGTEIKIVDNIGKYGVYKNGTYTVIATDNVGNVTTENVEVTKLEKEIETSICKRATTLHTEECTWNDFHGYGCSSEGYTETGSKSTTTITYGNEEIIEDELNAGDAFDCDVNGDGVYDSETERFYYVSDYYNTESKEFESDTAVLVYYSNVSKGVPSNSSSAYSDSSDNKTPNVAVKELPTTNQWSNVSINDGRKINGQYHFSYSENTYGYSARLLTVEEANSACEVGLIKNYYSTYLGELSKCIFLLENTAFSSKSNETEGYWLEAYNQNGSYSINGIYLSYAYFSSSTGVRPVIEVPKSDISLTDEGVSKSALTAYKTGTTTEIKSGVWSNSYLDYKFGKMTSNNNDNVMYYCIGDSCTPNIMVGLNEIITIEKDGEYTLRYAEKDSNGDFGEIKEYSAKVDITEPNVTVEGNPTEITNEYVTLKINANDNDSGVRSVTVNSENITINDGIGTYTVGTNDTYTVLVTDNAGNITIEPVIVSKIDRGIVCKRAATLHTEECVSGTCITNGYSKGDIVSFGNLNENSTELTSGDAFDCDVNGDGTYDPGTERFYYVSDYFNTKTKTFDSDWATLIYYSPVSNGVSDNTTEYSYDSKFTIPTGGGPINFAGPVTAILQLPTISQWSNIALKSSTRSILNENNGNTTTIFYGSHVEDYSNNTGLPKNFSYSEYSARLLTLQEFKSACDMSNIDFSSYGIIDTNKCEYIFENAFFTTNYTNGGHPVLLETASSNSWLYVSFVTGDCYYSFPANSTGYIKPVIDVKKNNILLTEEKNNLLLNVYKANTNIKVIKDNYSDSYLDYEFGSITNNTNNSKIYYCIGEECIPNIEISENSKITIEKDGEYKLRYATINDSGITSDISEYVAKVDINAPTLTIDESTKELTNKNVTLKINAVDVDSGINKVLVNGKVIELNNGEYSYTVTNNGTFVIVVIDNSGNTNYETLKITNIDKGIICKRATTLHVDTSKRSIDGKTTYGNLSTSKKLKSGDAFDCDVNGDGVYDSETERFYYVSDYYDTYTKTFDSKTATLIYYSVVKVGEPVTSRPYEGYNEITEKSNTYINYNGPVTSISQLPTTEQWSNVSLKMTTRAILNESSGNTTVDSSDSKTVIPLTNKFSYEGYAARFLTLQETLKGCGRTYTQVSGNMNKCKYLLESSDNLTEFWLETVDSSQPYAYEVGVVGDYIHSIRLDYPAAVRPAIDVDKVNIEY